MVLGGVTLKDLAKFVFDSDLRVGDPAFEVLEGHVRISDSVLKAYPFFYFYAEDDVFNFFADYNLKNNEVKVVTTYYPQDNLSGKVIELPLSDGEKAQLIDCMKGYCLEKYHVPCLTFLNWQREAAGLEKLELPMKNLELQISEAQEVAHPGVQKEASDGCITLWGRLGVDIKMTPEEFAVLKNGGREADNLLVSLIRSDRCRINGDTYFPEAPNDKHISEDLEFDLDPQALHKDTVEREQRGNGR